MKSTFYYFILSMFLCCFLANENLALLPIVAKSTPNFGVIFNEDGDFAFLSPNPVKATNLLVANVNAHAALGISTYVFSIGAGSDVLYYPTKVASTYGWRTTKYEIDNESWKARINSARHCIDAGLDAIQIAGVAAKKNNLRFIPSMRMNDSHFMSDPYNYPLTGKFWLENAPALTIKESPMVFSKDYGNLLDFSFEKVRNYRLAIFNEVVDRNKKIIDGFELDFNRVQVFFPKEKSANGKMLMTDFVRKVRKKLNQLAKEQHHPYYLFVRIPPSSESCEWAGLDINTWIKEGLVDVISPAQLMTLAHDMPIANMIKIAKQYQVKVYPSIYPRTSNRVALIPSDSTLGLGNKIDRTATLAETLAAAANYDNMGADGVYLYNYKVGDKDEGFRPHPNWMYALVASLLHHHFEGSDKVFAVTKTYYNDNLLPSYAYVKQLPKKVTTKETFSILIGALPIPATFPLLNCVLRMGIKNDQQIMPTILLNGNPIHIIKTVSHLKANAGKALTAEMADYSLVFSINDAMILRSGLNNIEVEGNNVMVTDLEIGISYFNELSSFMLGKEPPIINSTIK